MGPSGSGKTTLLNLIGGIDRPTAERSRSAGSASTRLSEGELARWRAANVGFIFQFYNLMPMLTAAQNVELPLLLTNLSRQGAARARRDRARDRRSRRPHASHYPREISGGQQQRVAIARAIVSDPKLLVRRADRRPRPRQRPTRSLDAAGAQRRLGKTIVMVTHDPAAASTRAARCTSTKASS